MKTAKTPLNPFALNLTALSLMTLAVACTTEPQTNMPPPQMPPPTEPPPVTPVEKLGKATRRLTVEQLRNSIPELFEGIEWTIRIQGRDIPLFEGLSRTLGEADYDRITANNIEPNALFAKFMDDMAGDVCVKAIARDVENPDESSRIIMRYEDPDENLRHLKLKFHAVHVPEGQTEEIAELRSLFDDISAAPPENGVGGPPVGWGAVCMALLTDPEFMAY